MPMSPVSYSFTNTDLASDLKSFGFSVNLGICIRTLGVQLFRSRLFG